MSTWTTHRTAPDAAAARVLLYEYLAEMVRRWHGRPERPDEVTAALAESPSDDLTPPTGLFLLARRDGPVAGCAGLRWRPGWAELTRVYIRPAHRGTGGGGALLAAVEAYARGAGADRIRLDTAATWSRRAPCTPATATGSSSPSTPTCTPSTGSRNGCRPELTTPRCRAKTKTRT